MNATQLYVWFCGKCKSVFGTEAEADRCCQPRICIRCKKVEAQPGWSTCTPCSDTAEVEREASRFERAEKVPALNWDGPVFLEGTGREGYSSSVADFIDYWQDDAEDASPKERPLPTHVWACHSKPCCHIDLDSVIEDASQEAHDNFELSDLSGVKELRAAVDAFNALNDKVHETWDPDYTKAIILGGGEA